MQKQEEEHYDGEWEEKKKKQPTISLSNDDKLYRTFIHSIKSQITRKNYLINIKYYMEFLGVTTLKELLDNLRKLSKQISKIIWSILEIQRNYPIIQQIHIWLV
jgi:hypothetical protein